MYLIFYVIYYFNSEGMPTIEICAKIAETSTDFIQNSFHNGQLL